MKLKKSALSLVIGGAVLATVASIGGATAGALLTGKDIKDGTVRKADLSAKVNARIDAPGTAGPAGPAGTDGKDGKDGKDALGYVSAGAGYAGLGAHAEWPADGQLHETVQKCKAGEVVTGGGYSTWGGAGIEPVKDLGGDADVQITVSAPYILNDGAYVPVSETDSRFAATQWVVRGYNHGETPVDVRAWVLCTAVN